MRLDPEEIVNTDDDDERGQCVMGTNRAERKRARRCGEGLVAPARWWRWVHMTRMSAQLIEAHGFDAVWVSGFGVATMTHATSRPEPHHHDGDPRRAAVRIDGATELPVVADCDNGFGGLSNVVRTVRGVRARRHRRLSASRTTSFPKRNSLYQGQSKSRPGRHPRNRLDGCARPRLRRRSTPSSSSPGSRRSSPGHGIEAAVRAGRRLCRRPARTRSSSTPRTRAGEIEGFLGAWQAGLGDPAGRRADPVPRLHRRGAARKGF